ncbi:acetyltransferase [Actinoplanes sp. SE50]|uniref:GNAT family N-acetyltransferase n=1 Tax=unclassified Actinoplanes TaxID=2626549 RepID=UPI00023EBD60|nr:MULTISPECIES: GNAT family N-acetyltransferase [unclassified Actinoplanes]AEV85094.1 Puromycin N-acetyltransferase [Actinoplanes sp. SE50/110]ATO83485.1 acetyltransferase [Actinoplanes sp. SE50]SLM00892.1 acetyltransferase [Actinoplanes sp. SE50/110]
MIDIAVAGPEHRTRIVSALVAAFRGDPVIRWQFPDDDSYPELAAVFFGHLFDKRVHRGAVWVAEGGNAVAIWEPPADASPAVEDVLPRKLPADVLARVRAYDDAVHAALPAEPYWYLGVLGTHPDHSGRRLGHAVMAEGLRAAAADGRPAVLETATEGNVRMYERAGWRVIAELTDPLPVWVLQNDTYGSSRM